MQRACNPGGNGAHLAVAWQLALSAAVFSTPLEAQALEPARLAAAREMMEVAGVAGQFDELMPLLAQQLSQSFMAVAPEKAEEIRQVFAQLPANIHRPQGRADRRGGEPLCPGVSASRSWAPSVPSTSQRAGAKLLAVQPQIARQSMALGTALGCSNRPRNLEQEARRS